MFHRPKYDEINYVIPKKSLAVLQQTKKLPGFGGGKLESIISKTTRVSPSRKTER